VTTGPSADDPDASGLLQFLCAAAHTVTVIARIRSHRDNNRISAQAERLRAVRDDVGALDERLRGLLERTDRGRGDAALLWTREGDMQHDF
jgi:hypothetical protein